MTDAQAVFQTYYDLYRNDYGVRPVMEGLTVAQAQAWIDARPDRPTGYGCPEAYARELAELAADEAAYEAERAEWRAARAAEAEEAAEAARFNVWDFDVTDAGRVVFHAH